ncbi:hypothetical protein J6X15_01090, partial [Candidatus Saccharibacteria bacterium]|nr:hypothetical protein [Candidatus Saccharibacteria bacterium]
IKRKKWRGWGRLFLKSGLIACVFYILFGVLFGVTRCVGEMDGDLVLFCRICKEYRIGDVMLMDDGVVSKFGQEKERGGTILGKVIARLSVRGFMDESSE